MKAEGTFEISLDPAKDEIPAGRMIIQKTYSGGLNGQGAGQMISKRTESGSAVYSAIEEFKGTVDGKSGSFTLWHSGSMAKDKQALDIQIVDGSGRDELTNISGTLDIIQKDGKHFYILNYQL